MGFHISIGTYILNFGVPLKELTELFINSLRIPVTMLIGLLTATPSAMPEILLAKFYHDTFYPEQVLECLRPGITIMFEYP
jgi:hypothetical protein